jgi:hypothetical protein
MTTNINQTKNMEQNEILDNFLQKHCESNPGLKYEGTDPEEDFDQQSTMNQSEFKNKDIDEVF